MNGVIIVDKPAGWTSHDVVNRMRRILQQRSVGHLGTLDPLATGVLPLVTGSLTRLAQFYTASEKTYEGVIRFGFATNTYDADGEPMGEVCPASRPANGRSPETRCRIPRPHRASAATILRQENPRRPRLQTGAKGKRSHPASRFKSRSKNSTSLAVEADRAHFRARVASGTYMRSIAHEMGQRLGCGAHLESLRRTAVAEFDISQAHTLEEIEAQSRKLRTIGRSNKGLSFRPELRFPEGKGKRSGGTCCSLKSTAT